MKYKHINKLMRIELSILRKKGYSLRAIAAELGVGPASVSRELKRNKMHDGVDLTDAVENLVFKHAKAEVKQYR